MLEALEECFPPGSGVTWTHPQGGLFLWLKLPAGMECQRLLAAALRENVACVPGQSFFPNEADGCRFMRLNFSNAQPDLIREGIRRLAKATLEQLGEMA